MNGETGFCIASGSGRSLSVGLLRIRGELAIGALFVPQTSHEGNWCQASIGLRHGTCCRLIWGLRASPRLFFSHSISITYRCGPAPVELWATR
jgi:hypothetical protein